MPINLKLPQLDSNPVLLAETRSNKINEFIHHLPFSDPIKAATDLIEELQLLNSQKIAYSNRINALELYRPAVMQIHLELITHFSSARLPISKNEQSFANAAEQLWQELSYGYKWALVDLQSKIFSINNDRATALVVQRAIHALKQIVFIKYLSYRTPTTWLWSEIHQLYFCALQQSAQSLTITETLSNSGVSTVNSVYTQTLLLALSNPHRLANQDIVKADAYLTNISDDAELKALGLVDSATGVFLIELDGSKPPIAFSKNRNIPNNDTDILLVTVNLARKIHTHLKLLQEGIIPNDGSLPANALSDRYQDLLSHLIKHFGKSPLRVFSRSKKNDGIELGIGMQDAHHFIPKTGNEFKNFMVPNSAIKPSRWQILNVGAGGYALRKFNSSQVAISVGDVAAIKNNSSSKWELGVVRWANINELNQLDIGLELISPQVEAVTIKDENKNTEVKALLLPELNALKQEKSVIVSKDEHSPGQQMTLINKNVETPILITKCLERTANYERFHFTNV